MVRPEIALLVFSAVAVVAAVLLWPRKGVIARLLALRRSTERVRTEDALKHLYNCEYVGRSCTVESLAGALEVSRDRSVRLLTAIEAHGLGRSEGGHVVLTEAGRVYALQVVRSHRLWERYLADETGIHPSDWHAYAEDREHTLTPAEANTLSARLGHPRYDPHGDPIPTADGVLPEGAEGIPLPLLESGETGRIVHLEDEPRDVYDRLVRAGLGPRMRVEMRPSAPGEVRFRAGGREHVFEPVVAANITVERTPDVVLEAGVETLGGLEVGESARVVRLSAACQGPQRRRLLDLGVVPGTPITAALRSASGDPVAFEIRGALIALRRGQMDWIQVRRESAPEGS